MEEQLQPCYLSFIEISWVNVGLGGNIGKSFAWQVADNNLIFMCLNC
jgi:hypothetical protein